MHDKNCCSVTPVLSLIAKSNLLPTITEQFHENYAWGGGKLSFHFLELPKPNLPRVNETVSKIIADECHQPTVWSKTNESSAAWKSEISKHPSIYLDIHEHFKINSKTNVSSKSVV